MPEDEMFCRGKSAGLAVPHCGNLHMYKVAL